MNFNQRSPVGQIVRDEQIAVCDSALRLLDIRAGLVFRLRDQHLLLFPAQALHHTHISKSVQSSLLERRDILLFQAMNDLHNKSMLPSFFSCCETLYFIGC